MYKKLTLRELLEKKVKDKKGISPVIATIIIVAVAIAISIAVASWLMGLWTGFTTTESVQCVEVLAFSGNVTGSDIGLGGDASDHNATIWIRLRNTGSAGATLDVVYIYNKRLKVGEAAEVRVFDPSGGNKTGAPTIAPGSECWVAVYYANLSAGSYVTGKIYTKAGNVITIPQTAIVAP
ncbi:MAG: archaellin/type IV pilin N-terminal domain-containing protein [Candidatus Nezhaarchaeales archaeon]